MLADVDPLRAALDLEHAADQIPARNEAVDPRVATRGSIVAEQQEFVRRDPSAPEAPRVAPVGLHVRLAEPPAVDDQVSASLRPPLARKPDNAFDVDAARAALEPRERRRAEDDDVVSPRPFRAVGMNGDDIHRVGLATEPGRGARHCGFHRRAGAAKAGCVLVGAAARRDDRHRRERQRSQHQWNEMRLGGQYVANTSPMRFLRGTRPHTRESHDEARLSPIIRYSFFGTRVSVPFGGMSDIVKVWVSRRSAGMYGSFSRRPLMYTYPLRSSHTSP